MENIAIILAGGSGQRMGNRLPKQFLSLAGKTILEHTLCAFQKNEHIDTIFIVTHPSYIEETRKVTEGSFYRKVSRILPGGAERYRSTLAALKACPPQECKLIIHDAVRPLVNAQMIDDCLAALENYEACTTAIPSIDTILVSEPDFRSIHEIPDRKFLFNVQTPQAFRKSILEQAYRIGLRDPEFQVTDDCGVVKKYLPEISVQIIAGSPSNIKITYPEDLITMEKLLQNKRE